MDNKLAIDTVYNIVNSDSIINKLEIEDIIKLDTLKDLTPMYIMFYINKLVRSYIYQNSYNPNIDLGLLELAIDESDLEYWFNNTLPELINGLDKTISIIKNSSIEESV